jgi:hypothetical protein
MEEKKNLASLSKGTKTTGKTTKKTSTGTKKTTRKTTTQKNNEKVVSDRELKAKETVSKLLDEVPLMNKKEDKKMDNSEVKKGTEWLEEQLQVLTEKNEVLEKEAVEAKTNYKKIFDDFQKLKQSKAGESNPEKEKVLQLFNELQDNYKKMGQNFRVYFPAFLNRMVMFFPFLSNHKKY